MSIGPKNPYRCKNLADFSYTDWVIANFVPNFVAMATGVDWGKMRLAAFNGHWPIPENPPVDAKISQIFLTQTELWPILFQISLPWQRGSIRGKCDWQHSMANPWKLPCRCKNLADISYTNRVIANFIPNFVAMATGVFREKMWLGAFDNSSSRTSL